MFSVKAEIYIFIKSRNKCAKAGNSYELSHPNVQSTFNTIPPLLLIHSPQNNIQRMISLSEPFRKGDIDRERNKLVTKWEGGSGAFLER